MRGPFLKKMSRFAMKLSVAKIFTRSLVLKRVAVKTIWRKHINGGLWKYTQIRIPLPKPQMLSRKSTQRWRAWQMQTKDAYTTKLVVSRHTRDKSSEVGEVVITFMDTSSRAISWHRRIFSIISSMVLQCLINANPNVAGNNPNTTTMVTSRKKRALKF